MRIGSQILFVLAFCAPVVARAQAPRSTQPLLLTTGSTAIGGAAGVGVDLQERRIGGRIERGLVVSVDENDGRPEEVFIEASEADKLVQVVDSLLAFDKNPTPHDRFSTSYASKNDLRVAAFSNTDREIVYAVGVLTPGGQRVFLNRLQMRAVRSFLAKGGRMLREPPE